LPQSTNINFLAIMKRLPGLSKRFLPFSEVALARRFMYLIFSSFSTYFLLRKGLTLLSHRPIILLNSGVESKLNFIK